MEHAAQIKRLEDSTDHLEELLRAPGQLSAKATYGLRTIGHYYGMAACDAFGRNDLAEMGTSLSWSVAFNALLVRFRGWFHTGYPDDAGGPDEFADSQRAAGPCVISQWDVAEASARAFILIAENDQRRAGNGEERRIQHGTVDALLISLFTRGFGIQARFHPQQPLIPDYQHLLSTWRTDDEAAFQHAMQAAAEFHLSRSRYSSDYSVYEFDDAFTRTFPIELLTIQSLRRRDGLPAFDTGHLLIDTPWSLIRDLPPIPPHPLAVQVEARLRHDFPLFS